jgi:N-acetylneuraminic acid mutarotase
MGIGVNGKLYVMGGYNVSTPNYLATTQAEVLDVASNTWSSIAPVPEPLTHSGIASDGTSIYLAGGYITDLTTGFQAFGTSDVWRYNIAANTWSAYVPLPAARAAGAMVILNNELHFFGGVDPTRTGQTNQWVLNLSDTNPQWTASTPMPSSRNHMAGEVLNGDIYAIGGQPGSDDSSPAADVYMFNPTTQLWTAVASLPTPLSHMTTGVIGGRIVVAGGTQVNDLPLDNVYAYDPATNTWSTQTSLPAPRLAPTGGVIGNELIVTTGFAAPLGFNTDTWTTTV